jgi:hypothetical protein
MLMSIDPGSTESAFTIIDMDTKEPLFFDKLFNEDMLMVLEQRKYDILVIEKIASYGMKVGKSTFDTCIWTGRFIQKAAERQKPFEYIYRVEEKQCLCKNIPGGCMKAKDKDIRQALIDRFGKEKTKGLANDMWSAYAVGITYLDK